MRLVLDTSCLFNTKQSSFKYFAEMIPRLRREHSLKLEILPSPYFKIPAEWEAVGRVHRTLIPHGRWLQNSRLRKVLSKAKWAIESRRLRNRLEKGNEKTIYQSFFYSLPPSKEVFFIANALDLIIEKFGETMQMGDWIHFEREKKRACFERADRILAISQSTKVDLIQYYGIPEARIDVIHLAVNEEIFGKRAEPREIADLCMKYNLSKKIILQVGGREHHRNFETLLMAYAGSPLRKEYELVSAGSPWNEAELERLKYFNVHDRVRVVPHPTDDELRVLYKASEFLVYPSLYEGFGMPLVEAMVAGVPVITTKNSGSIPEIAGEAALYFESLDATELTKRMEEMTNPVLREAMVCKGFENVKRFSWDETARLTLASYRRLLESA